MRAQRSRYIRNFLFPCLYFSAITGIATAFLVFLLKIAASAVISASSDIYAAVRLQPIWLPVLILGAALLGLMASLILSAAPSCVGGGIPTALSALRGITNFSWIKSIILLPISALMTFFCGIPLGNEGPCVQMGTAVGMGTVRLFGKKKGWRRYIMTGGASAGFSVATGAPITGIIFAMEEAHRRFSPMLFTVASMSVIFSQITARLLSYVFNVPTALFDISVVHTLPSIHLWVSAVVGLVCGLVSIVFTFAYKKCDKMVKETLNKLPNALKFPLIFAFIALIGFFSAELLGSGHELTEHLMSGEGIWYMTIIIFLARALLLMIANTAGVTGGIFVPTLAFGAMLGSLCAEGLVAFGLIGAEHRILIITLGMVSFLGASSKIPLTASFFALETFFGVNNILPVIIGVTVAFLVTETSRADDFGSTVIKAKAEKRQKGKTAHTVEVALTARPDSFVIGKERTDILWPANCVLLTHHKEQSQRASSTISIGDVFLLHYVTYDPAATADELEALLGEQSEETRKIMAA